MGKHPPQQVHLAATMRHRPAAPPPVALLLGAAWAQRVVGGRRPARRCSRAASALVATASLALAGASAIGYLSRGTTVSPHRIDAASALVTTGPNRVSRNPIYLAMAGLLLAHALHRRSWPALAPVAAFVGVVTRWQIRPEEAALSEAFAAEFDAYRTRVPRWIGLRSLDSQAAPPSRTAPRFRTAGG